MADKDQANQSGVTGDASASDALIQHTLDSGSGAAVPGAQSDQSSQKQVNSGDAVVDHTIQSGSGAAIPDAQAAAANTKTGSGAESGVDQASSDQSSGDNRLGGAGDLADNGEGEVRESAGVRDTANQGDRGDVGDVGVEGDR